MPAAHVLLLGGVRSGKSRRAPELAAAMAAPVDVIATACAEDEEIRRRIEAHRRERPSAWRTHEEPLALARALYRALLVMSRRAILVANETGLGVVPATPLARQFIDLAGAMRQRLASLCQRVELLVAGLPLVLKGHDVTD
jgi:adenosylcobinamide kinase/adenosylcobinamide-phosphate guanylyltransferase